ncbi:transglycosylase domain-containing protein [Candidatus Microgenomates bacterium]|nr:transglycosylase domain-containing protein [Candidatus Microgenomates bacterium]
MLEKIKARWQRFRTFARIHPLKAILAVVAALLLLTIITDLRLIFHLTSSEYFPISTKILDRNGQLIYEIFTEKRRTPISLSELPPYVKQATIAIEDKDFYKHFGVDPAGIIRAARNTIFNQKLQGGSTITQQLVKTALLTPERSLRRKFRELSLTLVAELIFSKDQILEMYLNQIPYGGTAYGIESASQTYFGKSASDLTLSEAALLAGLPAAPTKFSPFGANPQLAKNRQQAVLRRMVEDKYITAEQADEATKTSLRFRKSADNKTPAGIHFALWIKEQLVEEFGERLVEQGGLQVTTTLDLDIQKTAEETVAKEVGRLAKQKVGNGAALVTHPKTGEILAMVGSKNYFAEDEDGQVNVTLSPRQPGSSIKPINYALGLLNHKVTPASLFADIPTCFQVVGQPLYCPINYDHSFHGPVQLRFALGNSYNLPAVKMLTLNTLNEFVPFAQKMGLTTITDPTRYGLSLTLGGGEVKMVDMAVTFGVFANGGIKQDLFGIREVKDAKGKILQKHEVVDGDRVLPLEVTFLISHILYDNNARQPTFGPVSYLVLGNHPEVSAKTGTTNDRRDNWTIGYDSDAVVAAWVGNNDNTPMSGAVSGVSGASPIWNKIMKFTLDKIEAGEVRDLGESSGKHGHPWSRQPDGVIGANICTPSGLLPPNPDQPDNPGCATRFEYFLEGTVPTETENLRRQVNIDKTTGRLANSKTPPENIEVQEHSIVTDILGTQVCLDCTLVEGTPEATESTVINPDEL